MGCSMLPLEHRRRHSRECRAGVHCRAAQSQRQCARACSSAALAVALLSLGPACGTVGSAGAADLVTLGDAAQLEAARLVHAGLVDDAIRCLQLLHRLGRWRQRVLRRDSTGSGLSPGWRRELGRGVSRLTWGMPGCPVERKLAAGGGAMACNSTATALAAFARRPLVMYIVDDAMDWLHFDQRAVLACPYQCLWAGAVEPIALADVLVYDCLQHPPTAGRLQRQARMLLCMESAAHLPRLVRADFLRGFEVTATYRRDSDVPLLYAPGNTSLYAYGHALAALQVRLECMHARSHAPRVHARTLSRACSACRCYLQHMRGPACLCALTASLPSSRYLCVNTNISCDVGRCRTSALGRRSSLNPKS